PRFRSGPRPPSRPPAGPSRTTPGGRTRPRPRSAGGAQPSDTPAAPPAHAVKSARQGPAAPHTRSRTAMAEHPAYPVGLRLTGRRVVVLGGGQVAQRRLPALIAAGADVRLVSPEVTPSVEAMAEAGEITWLRRRYAEGDLADAWYALIATSDKEANARASAEAERNRVWCVRSDDADQATAWTPATGHSEGVTVAVLTTD